MVALLSLLTAVAVALAARMTGWVLLAVPFTAIGTYGAWLGLPDEELSDALWLGYQ